MQIVLYGSIAWRHPLGIGQVIDWARRFGWDGVDARGISLDVAGDVQKRINAFGYDMLGPRQIRKSARTDLRMKLAGNNLHLLGIYCSSPVNLPGEQGDAFRALFQEYLQLGADLGVTWIRSINNTTADGAGGSMSEDEAYQRTVDGLVQSAPMANDLGVGILLENNENTTTSNAESLKRLKADIGNACRVGITYDPVNAYFQGEDVEAGFDALAGQIDVLHLKNVRRSEESRWDYVPRGNYSYEWKTLSDGDLDWPQLVQKAADGGYDGPLVYEYVNPFKGMPLAYWDTLPEPESAAENEGKYMRQIVDSVMRR